MRDEICCLICNLRSCIASFHLRRESPSHTRPWEPSRSTRSYWTALEKHLPSSPCKSVCWQAQPMPRPIARQTWCPSRQGGFAGQRAGRTLGRGLARKPSRPGCLGESRVTLWNTDLPSETRVNRDTWQDISCCPGKERILNSWPWEMEVFDGSVVGSTAHAGDDLVLNATCGSPIMNHSATSYYPSMVRW